MLILAEFLCVNYFSKILMNVKVNKYIKLANNMRQPNTYILLTNNGFIFFSLNLGGA